MTATRRELVVAGLALAGAVLLALLALDALRWGRGIGQDDVRFETLPAERGLWERAAILPLGMTERLLGGRDDLAYRRALSLYWLVRPGAQIYHAETAELRGRVQVALADVAKSDPDPRIRSRATNLLGVLTLDQSTLDPNERAAIVTSAIGAFRDATQLDPDYAEAKLNLELALRIGSENDVTFARNDPSGNPDVGSRAGSGRAGGGY